MGPLIVGLGLIGLLILWITTAVKLFKFGPKGVRYFFMALLFMIILGVIAFVLVVAPSLDCTGFLCGIEEIFIFFGICLVLLVIFPLILLTKVVTSLRKEKKFNNDLLDSEPVEE